MRTSRLIPYLAAATLTVGLAACGDGSSAPAASGSAGGGDGGATAAKGPITIWMSNNAQEVTWAKAVVAAWNSAHSDQQVTAQEIPAGKSSEEVIGAAITAGSAPCLVLNVAPAAVPAFQKQGGLVALDSFSDGVSYLTERSGDVVKQYASSDGKTYQLPWKANPVVIMYNKAIFTKAGIDTKTPPLSTYADFLATSKKIVDAKAAQAAIWPSPSSEFFQPWLDFMPLYAAQTKGKQLVDGGAATFNSDDGKKVANFWAQLYKDKLAPQEKYNGDAFAEGKSAMPITGPWAIAAYKGKVDFGVAPVPTEQAMPAKDVYTFPDSKNVSIFTACKNQGTAWEFLKFATSKEQDGKLLDVTGQMPLRKDLTTAYADYFTKHPEYTMFADQASRTVDVPNVPNSIEVWQTFRDAWSSSVIFGKTSVDDAFGKAASKIDTLVKG